MSEDIVIIAGTMARAKAYAERYGYEDAVCIAINSHAIRGYAPKRMIFVDPIDEYQAKVVAPIKCCGTEILHA